MTYGSLDENPFPSGVALPRTRLILSMSRHTASPNRGSFAALLVTIALLLAPAAVLGYAAYRYGSPLLAVGAIAQVLGSALLVRSRVAWRPPTSGVVIALYLMALGWLWFATQESPDPFARFSRGLFLATAVGLLVGHDMIRTGLEPRRRARTLCRRLIGRVRWPRTVEEFTYLPEVRGLHTAVREDPSLAFDLLADPRDEVHLAAMAALQDRAAWRWEEAAVVLATARKTLSPEVRALALRAVATADNIDVTQGVGEYLKDPSAVVRAAACEGLLAGGERRWAVARQAVRTVLADPAYLADGPLPGAAGRLSQLAVCDLTGWAMEPAPLAERAVRTLLVHYDAVLRDGTDPALSAELGRQVTDGETPPILRVELATLLRARRQMPHNLLDRMTDPDQPSPVRLIAVEEMLANDPNEPSALDVLRGLGRQSNRETALAVARIVQQYCGFDFGLPAGSLTPKIAQEVAQRVYRWATGKATDLTTTPGPGGVGSGSGSRGPFAVFGSAPDDDALGGLPPGEYPASVPGMSSPRLRPRSR